jgi:hypothetical protein
MFSLYYFVFVYRFFYCVLKSLSFSYIKCSFCAKYRDSKEFTYLSSIIFLMCILLLLFTSSYAIPVSCKKSLKIPKRAIRIRKSKKNRQHNGHRKGQKNKQRSTKHYTESLRPCNTNPLKTGDELRCSGKVGSSCSTCGTRHVTRILKCGKNITVIYTTIIQKISIGKFKYILKKWSFHQSICDINI